MTSTKRGDFSNNSQIFPKKITVLYNEIRNPEKLNKDAALTEAEGLESAETIADALKAVGHSTDLFELHSGSVNELRKLKNTLIFNLADGVGDDLRTESKVPQILDEMGLRYTGAAKAAMELTTNKALTKILFQQNDLPTPDFTVFATVPASMPPHLKFPLITKPVNEDCSLGISSSSVVHNFEQLQRNVKKLLDEYQEPVLAEGYIDGREINATVFGNGKDIKVLPLSEIVFSDAFDKNNIPKIVDFEAKWIEDSQNYNSTAGVCPAVLDLKTEKLIEEIALKAYLLTGARDYARVDMRLDKNNVPQILEVNVNPDLSPGMGASRSAKTHGWDYGQFISAIASAAAARYV